MKNNCFHLLILIFLITGCEKKDPIVPPVTPVLPQHIELISGDNQKGFPYYQLSDSILIKVTLSKPADTLGFSYHFMTSDIGKIISRSYIKNNDLYISAAWLLNGVPVSQELKFYTTEKCDSHDYLYSNCKKIDSLSVKAFIKKPWTQVYSGAGGILSDMHFSDDKYGIAVGDLSSSIGYVKTEDGGLSWSFTSNSRNDLYNLYFSDPDTGVVIMVNNWALFTNDGGKSFHTGDWTPPFVGNHSSNDYYMLNSKTMYSVGWQGSIARSINGGKTWEKYQGFNFINAMYAVTCPSANVCYASGDVAKVVKTTDGGKSWVEQNVWLNNALKAIFFIDNNTGYAGGQYGALIRTADGGKNWEIKTSGLKYTIIKIYFSDKNTGYAVSSAGGIVKTTDGGNTWSLINKEGYGVYELYKVYFRGNIVWGVGGSIYKYDLLQ